MSMMVQRWRISSNSQQFGHADGHLAGCLWWFKDEEFQAIHNLVRQRQDTYPDVYDGSKMKNFKQFTTEPLSWDWMSRCLWWFKDEEFQAIHNWADKESCHWNDVYDGSKMKNFKQFTTTQIWYMVVAEMSMMVQRWRISSNSQQNRLSKICMNGCLWWFKDEEFQAIHNTRWGCVYN